MTENSDAVLKTVKNDHIFSVKTNTYTGHTDCYSSCQEEYKMAIEIEHTEIIPNMKVGVGCIVRTRWFDTKKDANAQAETYRANGADLSRVFTDNSVMGKYRVTGHFYSDMF